MITIICKSRPGLMYVACMKKEDFAFPRRIFLYQGNKDENRYKDEDRCCGVCPFSRDQAEGSFRLRVRHMPVKGTRLISRIARGNFHVSSLPRTLGNRGYLDIEEWFCGSKEWFCGRKTRASLPISRTSVDDQLPVKLPLPWRLPQNTLHALPCGVHA